MIANEIDHMYFTYACENKGKIVDEETANAVNESIDRILDDLDEGAEWLSSPEVIEFTSEL